MQPEYKLGDDPVKDDAYAQALLRMTTMDFEARQAQLPGQKHFISKKLLLWTAASLIFMLLVWAGTAIFSKKHSSADNTQQTQQLIKGVTNSTNPDAY